MTLREFLKEKESNASLFGQIIETNDPKCEPFIKDEVRACTIGREYTQSMFVLGKEVTFTYTKNKTLTIEYSNYTKRFKTVLAL